MTTTINNRTELPVLPNLHSFKVQYKKGKVHIEDLYRKEKRYISYNHEYNNAYEIALAFLMNKGFVCIGQSNLPDYYIIHSTTFGELSIKA